MGEECFLLTWRSGQQLQDTLLLTLSQSLTPAPNNILIPAITGAIKTHLSPFLGTIVSYLSPNLQIITSSCSYDQKHDNKHCWWPTRPDTLIQEIENTIRLLITWCSRAYTVIDLIKNSLFVCRPNRPIDLCCGKFKLHQINYWLTLTRPIKLGIAKICTLYKWKHLAIWI